MSTEKHFKSYSEEGTHFKTRKEALNYFESIKDSIISDAEYYYSWIEENLDESIENFDLIVDEIEDEKNQEDVQEFINEIYDLAKIKNTITKKSYEKFLNALVFFDIYPKEGIEKLVDNINMNSFHTWSLPYKNCEYIVHCGEIEKVIKYKQN